MIDDETADKLSRDPHTLVGLAYRQGRSVEAVRGFIKENATPEDRIRLNENPQSISTTLARYLADWAGLDGSFSALRDRCPLSVEPLSPEHFALRALSDSADDIEHVLRSLGVHGLQENACHCAISNYIRRFTGAIFVITSHYDIIVDGRHFEPSAEIQGFIRKFDNGNTSGIQSQDAADTLCLKPRD